MGKKKIEKEEVDLLNSKDGLHNLLRKKRIRLDKSIKQVKYAKELRKLQEELIILHNWVINNEKKVVVVQGLGFVGSVMSLVVANAFNLDYAVIGVDLPNENSYWKICSINERPLGSILGLAQLPSEDTNRKSDSSFLGFLRIYVIFGSFVPVGYHK